jgi:glycosyltransferase involved in cell wall biosynthesis
MILGGTVGQYNLAYAVVVARPLVTIVTPSYNQREFLEEAICSVLAQDYEPIEYLVLDGGSTDGSVEVIRRYSDRLGWWTSEPDRGQADALNKGFARARGDVLGWLCSDDTLLPGAVARMVDALAVRSEAGLVYGDALWTDDESKQTGSAVSREWNRELLQRGGSLPLFQPSSLFRRAAWAAAGPFDVSLDYLFDTVFFLKVSELMPAVRIPEPLATYRVHRDSKSGRIDEAKIAEYARFGDYPFDRASFAGLSRQARARKAAYLRRASWMLSETGQPGRARRLLLRSVAVSPAMSLRTSRWLVGLFLPSRSPRS